MREAVSASCNILCIVEVTHTRARVYTHTAEVYELVVLNNN